MGLVGESDEEVFGSLFQEEDMRNSIAPVFLILLIVALGCTLPGQQSPKQEEVPRQADQKESSDEAEKLKEKIAELEKQKLEEKIEELEKKIDQKPDTTAARTPSSDKAKPVPKGFARVNSPNDGFLALRSEPNADIGVRVNKIPHGTTIRIYECGARTTVNGRSGRWCQVVYRRDIGWVFDAYLVR